MADERDHVMVIDDSGASETFKSMDDLKGASLKPGIYEVWRFGGMFTVEELPARSRVKFESAAKRQRRKSS